MSFNKVRFIFTRINNRFNSYERKNVKPEEQIINIILLNYWLILLISFVFLFIAVKKTAVLLFIIYYILFLIFVEYLKIKKNVLIASRVLITGVWILITIVCIMEGTVLTIFATWYISLAIVVAILLGKKSIYFFTGITLASTFLIVLFNTDTFLNEPFFPVPPLVSWFILMVALVQAIIPIYVTVENFIFISGELEEKVAERTKSLEEANKDLELYVYSLSHDLRGPLEINIGLIEILKDQDSSQFTQSGLDLLNRVENNLSRTKLLADDLLKFFTLKNKSLNKEQLNMNMIINKAFDNLIRTSFNTKLKLIIDQLPDDLGDPLLITQVWTNLISNALKFTKKEENPYIRIGSMSKNAEHIYYIKDNGIGFDMSDSKLIFQPFQRLHNIDEYKGNGIGLAFVHSIITKHGGSIWYVAEKNKGATFFFTLGQ